MLVILSFKTRQFLIGKRFVEDAVGVGVSRQFGRELGWLLLAVLLAGSGQGKATVLGLKGELVMYAHPAEERSRPFVTANFHVYLHPPCWAVDIADIEYHHPKGGGPSRIRYSGDGTSSYMARLWGKESIIRTEQYLENNSHQELLERFQRFNGEDAVARAGNYPQGLWNFDAAPWLAFCSGEFLAHQTNGTVPNIFVKFAWPGDTIAVETSEMVSQAIPVYERIKLYQGSRMPIGNGKGSSDEASRTNDSPLLGLDHATLEWRRHGNHVLPARFIQQVYSVRETSGSRRPHLSAVIYGTLTEVEVPDGLPEGLQAYAPSLMPATYIRDRRVNIGRPSLVYQSGDRGWLDSSAEDLQERIEAILEARRPPVRKRHASMRHTIVGVIVLTLLPLIWLLKNHRHTVTNERHYE
jgi:hypothetical protein